ncbi:propionyl-CoA carboxylase [Tasmannia lanceolata]|uniref:propionyl-CoA carboxylase n=1 Tax=Tasmannia lanceolata TaxID=3420 RepID=UPI004062DB45
MENKVKLEVYSSELKLRENVWRRKEKVYIGCGAGFRGDRPLAALKLLQRVKELDYLVLECLAERTLAERYQVMMSGGDGYDSQISDWMSLLLPLAVERGVCIVTNMGAVDPLGAQKIVLDVARSLGLDITVSVAYEVALSKSGGSSCEKSNIMEGGVSTYLGAAPIVQCLEKYKPQVVITSRVADAALFLGPMVYELGWNWNDFQQLAQGSLAGHLLECGCQLTGGYFMHPGDKNRNMPFQQLLEVSLPYAEVGYDGKVCVAKAAGSGGIINFSTCAQQLLYEVGDPGAYVTPDVIIDFRDVSFQSLSNDKVLCVGAKPSDHCFPDKLLQLIPKDCGWKGWGEISYGGHGCIKRAEAAEFLVRSWMEEVFPGTKDHIFSYIIGLDSLKAIDINESTSSSRHNEDIRLRMDGLFDLKEHAVHFVKEFTALYTNGPAGGGGISTGNKKEIILQTKLVGRDCIFWLMEAKRTENTKSCFQKMDFVDTKIPHIAHILSVPPATLESGCNTCVEFSLPAPAPSGQKIPLYQVAHSRAGDKGNDLNFSIIPHYPRDIERLKAVITPEWVKGVVSVLVDASSLPDPYATEERNNWVDEHVRVEIYEAKGIHSLNVVVRNILDGGVNCSRRIDRHGKSVSDLILCQQVMLSP